MAGHTLVLPMGLIVTVLHSKNRRDGWTCITHVTDSEGHTQQEQVRWLDIQLSYPWD